MNTKEFLKAELDKLDKNAYWEIEGYGNVEFICKVMELYADVVNKKKIEKDKMADTIKTTFDLRTCFTNMQDEDGWIILDKAQMEEILKQVEK